MRIPISNFTSSNQLVVEPVNNSYMENFSRCGVRLTQSSGGMHFQHDMIIEQAREMAAALIKCADEAEARKYTEATA